MTGDLIRRINVEIKALRPYLQHRRPSSEEEVKKSQEITRILQKNPFDRQAQQMEAELGSYKNEKGYYIPAVHIHEAMVNAAKQVQVKGQGKKTYKDYVKSYIFIEPDEIPIVPQKYEIYQTYVRIKSSGILRSRPCFKDWRATFNLIITEPTLPVDTIKEILEIAGTRVGIGDYRPRFGLFTVSKFKLNNAT